MSYLSCHDGLQKEVEIFKSPHKHFANSRAFPLHITSSFSIYCLGLQINQVQTASPTFLKSLKRSFCRLDFVPLFPAKITFSCVSPILKLYSWERHTFQPHICLTIFFPDLLKFFIFQKHFCW